MVEKSRPYFPHLKSCCGYFSLRTAALLVGWFSVVGSIFGLFLLATGPKISPENNEAAVVILLMICFFSGLFLTGVIKKIPEYMIPLIGVGVLDACIHIIALGMMVVYLTTVALTKPLRNYNSDEKMLLVLFIPALILLLFKVHILLVIKSYYNVLIRYDTRSVVQSHVGYAIEDDFPPPYMIYGKNSAQHQQMA